MNMLLIDAFLAERVVIFCKVEQVDQVNSNHLENRNERHKLQDLEIRRG